MVFASLQRLFPYTLIQYDTERDEPLRDANGLCVETPVGEKSYMSSFEIIHLFVPLILKLNKLLQTQHKIQGSDASNTPCGR